MAEQYFMTLAEMPVCRCGRPLTEKGMVRRITSNRNARAGPQIGREKSSITRVNLLCHSCGRDNVVEYLWVDRWERNSMRSPPQLGYQIMPGDDPAALMGLVLAARERDGGTIGAGASRPGQTQGLPLPPATVEDAARSRAWIAKILSEYF